MNKEEPHRDQAERLRRKIEKITDDPDAKASLPPRSRVHQQKNKKVKFRLKYPIIRLLALFFILLPIVSFSIYTINENKKPAQSETVSNDRENYELVDVEEDEETEEIVNEEERSNLIEREEETTPSLINNDQVVTPEKKPITADDPKNQEEKVTYHKVQPNETLFSISMKYFHSQSGIEKIRQANGIKGNEIQVGQTIKIPLN